MSLTPRQIAGCLHFVGRRIKAKAAQDLSMIALGSRGDPKDVKKSIKEWSR